MTEGCETHQLEREFTVPGRGTADGALGIFTIDAQQTPLAVIELKGADVDLDRDRFNGRTPVQQCWDYLNALPGCPWAIVSNFVSIRLYHRDHGSRAFQLFTLQGLRKPELFDQFYHIFGPGGLLPTRREPTPRAELLLLRTGQRQREVGDELYQAYSNHRLELIHLLHTKRNQSLDQAISIAQKLLDRIIFVAFCEDRGLLPNKIIERTWRDIPPLARVTNPRWQNFLNLFQAVNRGHKGLDLEEGYNGGLFAHDPEVDDLQLDDHWTDFFRGIGAYDFRDEINVDVLGHLFEKSITELEKLRAGGLFGNGNGEPPSGPTMPTSAQRKRFGIYYTPPDFTTFLVQNTVGEVFRERCADVARQHKIDPDQSQIEQSQDKLVAYWHDCLAVLRALKVCDPACGSGAFLIRAYDYLEEQYAELIDNLALSRDIEADRLTDGIPDLILADNLFGVDVSPEAVEITQLALWIRSARRGRTLADLSHNIVCRNSLVDDADVHPRAMKWAEVFPAVFERDQPGFDCVIGNPPWERLKLQEREFFALSAPAIAGAVNAAQRRKLIAQLEKQNPALFARYLDARQAAERILDYARRSGRYPLTGRGDINTYMLFTEIARNIVAPRGRVGLLVPSGIASDKTTKDIFTELMSAQALIRLYDFENRKGLFPDVHRSFKFSTLVFGGSTVKTPAADFAFFAHTMDDLKDKQRHIALSADDMALVNPNTHTCPVFRTRRDAELTKSIYRRVPVLVDKNREQGGNPWGIKFVRMFDQTNDAELFHTAEQLAKMGFKPHGNVWKQRRRVFLPLYEAKMVQAFDHRAASVLVNKENWLRQGQTKRTSLVEHQNPEFVVQPRWWIEQDHIETAIGEKKRLAYICFKNVTSPTNERTMIASLIPWSAVGNSAPLIIPDENIQWQQVCCLLANLNCFILDYIARQKIGNVNLNFFLIEQFPMLSPDTYSEHCPWSRRQILERWISERVLKLTCTANDMLPLAEAADFKLGVHKWKVEERAQLRAELDAAYFLLYGIDRDDVDYILSTFTGTLRRDTSEIGTYRTAELILQAYDDLRK
ncbi:MAG: N-6 DNA methylase [Phycisphaerae bacterium]|nr:N-6 DNA methylase [Phycisphaerae bacterium]